MSGVHNDRPSVASATFIRVIGFSPANRTDFGCLVKFPSAMCNDSALDEDIFRKRTPVHTVRSQSLSEKWPEGVTMADPYSYPSSPLCRLSLHHWCISTSLPSDPSLPIAYTSSPPSWPFLPQPSAMAVPRFASPPVRVALLA